MNRVLQYAHLALLLCGAALCASGGWFFWTLKIETAAESQALRSATDQLTVTLQTINQDCGSGHPCGTLADIGKTLNTIRGTAGQVEIAAHHEDARIAILDAQEAQLASDLHLTLTNASSSLQSANSAILEGRKVLASTNATIETESSDLHQILITTAATAQQTNAMMVQVTGIAVDGHRVADHLEQEIDHPVKAKWYIRILPTSIRALIAGGQIYSAVK